MTMQEKLSFIEADLQKMMIKPLGDIPEDKEQAIEWYGRYIKLETLWCEKYKDNSLGRYALKIAAIFNDRCEYIYHDRFGSYGNVDYRRKENLKNV